MNENSQQEDWDAFDATLKDNRVGGSLRDAAYARPTVQFSGTMSGDPWAAGWGTFADDPLFDLWTSAINDYRENREAEEKTSFAATHSAPKSGKQAEIIGGEIG